MNWGAGRSIVLLLAALALAGGLVACGSSSSGNSNDAKIETAEAEAADLAAAEREVEAKLHTYETETSFGPWFRAGPGECSLNNVVVGEDAADKEDYDQAVVSPDGDVAIIAVPVNYVGGEVGATQADCLKTVVAAMGWDE